MVLLDNASDIVNPHNSTKQQQTLIKMGPTYDTFYDVILLSTGFTFSRP